MNTILVTGIGGVVGQGILRNLRAMDLPLTIAGTNTTPVSAGNHLCDSVHQVPYAYEPQFVDAMRAILDRTNAELIIPSTDYEAYYLALNKTLLPSQIAASPPEVTRFCLDKYLNHQEFGALGVPFAPSILPSAYQGEFSRTVVKPREGRGSRDIFIDPPSPGSFDDSYVVQQYLEGDELTTTAYVLRTGALHGFITMRRELEQGNTARCEVLDDHDEQLEHLVRKIIDNFPFRGSFNIQSRVTPNGIIPFEVNCRISGTNSVRGQFGFPDVQYTVQEYLLNQVPLPPKIVKGSAVRIMHDVIYPGLALSDIANRHDVHRIF